MITFTKNTFNLFLHFIVLYMCKKMFKKLRKIDDTFISHPEVNWPTKGLTSRPQRLVVPMNG